MFCIRLSFSEVIDLRCLWSLLGDRVEMTAKIKYPFYSVWSESIEIKILIFETLKL